MNNNKSKIKVNRADIPFNIKADDMITKTDLGRYSKIVHVQNDNSKPSPIQKISKTEYVVKDTGEIKQYNLDKPTAIKDIKKKLRKYEELVMYNFAGGRSELFITLTCYDNVQDIQTIKQYFKEFTDKLKAHEKYNELEYVAIYEQSAKGRWHIHLFIKYPNNKVLNIPYMDLLALWGKGNVHIFQNLNTMQTLNHSADKRQEKLERLKQFPKYEQMYCRSKGIKTPPKETLEFQKCPEYNSSDYKQLSRKTYVVQNENTDQVVNAVTTAMYKHVSTSNTQPPKETASNSNDNTTAYSPTMPPTTSSEKESKIREMIERQNDPNNTWYWEFI